MAGLLAGNSELFKDRLAPRSITFPLPEPLELVLREPFVECLHPLLSTLLSNLVLAVISSILEEHQEVDEQSQHDEADRHVLESLAEVLVAAEVVLLGLFQRA